MSQTPDLADEIRSKVSKAEQKVSRLESALDKARQELDELTVTMRVLSRHGLIKAEGSPVPLIVAATDANETQTYVLGFVPRGEAFAASPKDVYDTVQAAGRQDISADYVRTTLWRFAKRGTIKSDSGLYWWASAPPPAEAQNVAAPDAETSEADNGTVGPLGGGSGFPPSTPAGSIPAGSTPSSATSHPAFDDDDDVPF